MVTSERWSVVLGKRELLLAFGFYQHHCNMRGLAQKWIKPSEINDSNIDVVLEQAELAGFNPVGTDKDRDLEEAVLNAVGLEGHRKVFTSYYGNAKVLKRFSIVIVRIAQFAPRFLPAHNSYVALAPSKEMLAKRKAGTMTAPQFKLEFDVSMDKLEPQKVYDDLLAMGHGKSVAILCYEKPPELCHREYVAKWLGENNIEVTEFPFI